MVRKEQLHLGKDSIWKKSMQEEGLTCKGGTMQKQVVYVDSRLEAFSQASGNITREFNQRIGAFRKAYDKGLVIENGVW